MSRTQLHRKLKAPTGQATIPTSGLFACKIKLFWNPDMPIGEIRRSGRYKDFRISATASEGI